MAADNEELARITEQVAYELERFGKISATTADALRDAEVGVKGFSDAVRTAPKAVGAAATDLAKAMYKGEKGAKAFNSSIDSMAQAADSASKVLEAMIPGGPVVKMLFAGMRLLVKGVAEATKVVNQQSDSLYKSFQSLAESGVAAAGGTTKLGQDFYKLGISVYDADKMLSMFAEHSQDLALFGKTAFQGADAFIDIVNASKPYRAELERLGLNQQAQNEAILQYVKTQTRMGNANKVLAMGQEEAAAAANKYILEQDAITKLLGISRKEQQKAIDDAMRNARFAANLDELIAENKTEEADQINALTSIARRVGGDFEKAIQDWTSGVVGGTAEAKKGIVSGGYEMYELLQRVKAGEFKGRSDDLVAAFQKAAGPMNEMTANTRTLTKAVGDSSALLTYESRRNLKLLTEDNQKMGEAYKAARKQQAAQIAGEDKRLKNQSETIVAQEDATLAAQLLVDKGIDPVVAANLTLAQAAVAAANALNKIAGVKKPGEKGTATAAAAKVQGGTELARKATTALEEEKQRIADRQQQKDAYDDKLKQLKNDKTTAFKTGKSNEEIAKIDAEIADIEKKRQEALDDIKTRTMNLGVLQRQAQQAQTQQAIIQRDLVRLQGEAKQFEEKIAAARKRQYEIETGQDKEFNETQATINELEKKREKNSGYLNFVDKQRLEVAKSKLEALKKSPSAEMAAAQTGLSNTQAQIRETGQQLGVGKTSLADLVARGESKGAGEYNAANYAGGKKMHRGGLEGLSSMSIGEVMAKQKSGDVFAAGRYQITPDTMKAAVKALGLKETDKFDPATQDKIFNDYLVGAKRPNVKAFLESGGQGDIDAAILDLAKEFASIGVPRAQTVSDNFGQRTIQAGEGYYAGVGGNPKGPAPISPEEVKKTLLSMAQPQTSADGGAIISGPLDGYKPNLLAHGTEAIIPIKDGAVPVNLTTDIRSEIRSALSEMVPQGRSQGSGLEESILAALNELIRVQKETNSISTKILRTNM